LTVFFIVYIIELEKIESKYPWFGQHPFSVIYTTHITLKMTDMISISRASLEQIYKVIGTHLGVDAAAIMAELPVIKSGKVSKKVEKVEKKPRANAGMGTAWSAFSSKIMKDHGAEVEAVKAEAAAKRNAAKEAGEPVPEDTRGAHLHWCSRYKAEHEEEWVAFKSAWELEHPKSSRSSSSANSVDDSASGDGSVASEKVPKKRGIKKDSECTAEELAERKKARAAKKAAKNTSPPDAEAASPSDKVEEETIVELEAEVAVEESQEENVPEFMDWSHKKVTYLRLATKDADGDIEWYEGGHIWLKNADGTRGAYAGKVMASGKIDNSASAMEDAPEIE